MSTQSFFNFFDPVRKILTGGVDKKRLFYLPRLFTYIEKMVLGILLLIFVVSGIVFISGILGRFTVSVPADGGTYREGLLKEPRFINPIYASNNDTDRDLINLIFSGLLSYDANGNIIPDLASLPEISSDAKQYTFHLRPVLWHDSAPVTADDVIFTIKTVQNPEYKSPLRANWQGVDAEKIDDHTVRLTLKQPYAPFIGNATLKIIPKHIWGKITPDSASLSELNLKPIGSGKYKFENFSQSSGGAVTEYTISRNEDYYGTKPHLLNVTFTVFPTQEELLAAYQKNLIDGVTMLGASSLGLFAKSDLVVYRLHLPRVFALFFNGNEEPAVADKNVRIALAEAIDKKDLILRTLAGGADPEDSPLPPGVLGHIENQNTLSYDPDNAKKLFEKAGWKLDPASQTWKKTETVKKKKTTLELTLTITTSDFPDLVEVAKYIQTSWTAIGVKTILEIRPISDLEVSNIKPRKYKILLFGEVYDHDPDPFAFWHSSQIKDPGLNIALYSNKRVDTLLEDARHTSDLNARKKKYEEFQKLVQEDAGAIFLYSPTYFYGVRGTVKGIAIDNVVFPSERFNGIENWYSKTKRVLKQNK